MLTPSQCRRGSDPRPAAATSLGPKNPGDPQAVSARTRGGSSANRTGTRTTPPTIFTKPRIGYWMPKGKTVEEETACPKRGIRQKILKTEELSETGARLGKPICAGRYRRIKAEQGRALQSDWRRRSPRFRREILRAYFPNVGEW